MGNGIEFNLAHFIRETSTIFLFVRDTSRFIIQRIKGKSSDIQLRAVPLEKYITNRIVFSQLNGA